MIELIQTIPAVVSYHFFRRCFRRRWWKEAELLSPLCAAIPPHVDDDVRPDYVNVLMPHAKSRHVVSCCIRDDDDDDDDGAATAVA